MDPAASSQQPNVKPLGQHPSNSTASIFQSLEVNREADVFGDDGSLNSPTLQRQRELVWERNALEAMNKQPTTEI